MTDPISAAVRAGVEDAKIRRLPVSPGDLTHDGLALALGDRWAHSARYVAAWGRWLFFDGCRWIQDETLHHMTLTREYLREVAQGLPAEQREQAKRLRSSDTVARVIGLARSNREQVATTDQWDADPYLLGTPIGPVNLRTGELLDPRPDQYITKSTAIAPAPPGTPAPIWLRTLDRITAGDQELLAYTQRWAGYCLTGDTSEHAFAFGYGSGGNGKGVFVNCMAGILADYATAVPTEMLMVSRGDAHPTELARLRGVRLALGSETEEGARWAEAKIKRLTGGDQIPARFMRQDYFEFIPQFKLFVIGNHRPSLRSVDEAMRRRLHLVPFTVTIPATERDPDLPRKLRAEWPAILRWMIDGCLEWRRVGLHPPDSVVSATEDYLEAEDALSLWLDERAHLDPNAWESTTSLFASWKRWGEAAGEFIGSQKRFTGVLEERGFERKRQPGTGVRGFLGIHLQT